MAGLTYVYIQNEILFQSHFKEIRGIFLDYFGFGDLEMSNSFSFMFGKHSSASVKHKVEMFGCKNHTAERLDT